MTYDATGVLVEVKLVKNVADGETRRASPVQARDVLPIRVLELQVKGSVQGAISRTMQSRTRTSLPFPLGLHLYWRPSGPKKLLYDCEAATVRTYRTSHRLILDAHHIPRIRLDKVAHRDSDLRNIGVNTAISMVVGLRRVVNVPSRSLRGPSHQSHSTRDARHGLPCWLGWCVEEWWYGCLGFRQSVEQREQACDEHLKHRDRYAKQSDLETVDDTPRTEELGLAGILRGPGQDFGFRLHVEEDEDDVSDSND